MQDEFWQTPDMLKKLASEQTKAEELNREDLHELVAVTEALKEEDHKSKQIHAYIKCLSVFPFTVHLFTEEQLHITLTKYIIEYTFWI